MHFDSVEILINEIKQGKMIILMDDPGRENEGDFVMAAECVTPEAINFMAKYGRGLVCMPLSEKRAKQLGLTLMVSEKNQNQSQSRSDLGTQFTNSIEAAVGVTTGISAADRACTIKAAVAKDATACDINQPGHIFPIIAQDGGVLTRAGHTESACDYAQLAGFEPAGAIVEILNEDGTMARKDDLFKIAKEHNIKIGTVADLIKYRMQNEKTLECVHNSKVQTRYGDFTLKIFNDLVGDQTHCVLQKGDDLDQIPSPVPVRVHDIDPLADILAMQYEGSSSCDLHDVMSYMQKEGSGVIILLDKTHTGLSLLNKIKKVDNIALKPKHDISSSLAFKKTGAGSRILHALGLHKIDVIGAPISYAGLEGFDLEIISYIDPKSGEKVKNNIQDENHIDKTNQNTDSSHCKASPKQSSAQC